jgi:hypothetical protein
MTTENTQPQSVGSSGELGHVPKREIVEEALLHAGKCRSWAAKTFNDAPDHALCVGAGDALLYAAQLLDAQAWEISRLRAGHERYEVVRLMNVDAFRDAYVLNRRTGKPFDEIVAELAPFFGLSVKA